MEDSAFCFQLTPYDTQRLLPQVSKALEKRTELISRERYPALWKITDRISGGKPAQPRSRLRTKCMAVLCLVLGIFLFVPGVTDPQELLVPLIAGALAIIIGILYLWRSRKHRKNPFDRSAQKLLAGKETLSTQSPVTVTFSENGMTFPPLPGKAGDSSLYRLFPGCRNAGAYLDGVRHPRHRAAKAGSAGRQCRCISYFSGRADAIPETCLTSGIRHPVSGRDRLQAKGNIQ